jgi:hypothetical protein
MRILFGGQTGVGRAAVDAALDCGLAIGGWCPRGRRAEDGVIAERYPLVETPSKDYRQLTKWNVRDSDATLTLSPGELSGGLRLTAGTARSLWIPAYAGMTARREAGEFVEARRAHVGRRRAARVALPGDS